MPIMPTRKDGKIYVVRKFNYLTGHHEIIKYFEKKEEAHAYTYACRKNADETREPWNYNYELITDRRPDLHHERLMEEWGYKDDTNNKGI